MKKMILGLTLMVTGLVCTAMIIMAAVLCPRTYSIDDIEGWYGCLLGMDLELPLTIFVILAVVGLVICIIETYIKKEK